MTEQNRLPLDDWADQDLLTKDEAAERLAAEIEQVTAELAGSMAGNDMLDRRLAALREAHALMTADRDTP